MPRQELDDALFHRAIVAGAAAEAEVDGRDFLGLSRADRDRYVERFRTGLQAMMDVIEPVEQTIADVVEDMLLGGER